MTDADFQSLDIETTMCQVLEWAFARSGAREVHWLSVRGLNKVAITRPEEALWNFSTNEFRGRHLCRYPDFKPAPIIETWAVWRELAAHFPVDKPEPFSPRWLAAGRLAYPLYFGDIFLGVMMIDGAPTAQDGSDLIEALTPGLIAAAKYIHFGYLYLSARADSYLDELTGLYNQRYLPVALAHEINRAERDRQSFTLLFLDVDYFKMVNDGRGHLVGSKLLIELGKVLQDQVRACDYCFRYGGDEFIVLLGSASPEDSLKVAERIRRSVEQTTYSVEGHNINLTVSIGLASFPQHASDAAGLIRIADQAMYYGKRKSRNIVFVAS